MGGVVVDAGGISLIDSGADHVGDPAGDVAKDERPPPPELVNQQDAGQLATEGDCGTTRSSAVGEDSASAQLC